MPLQPGYNYEYKYVVLESQFERAAGEAPGYYPDWGFAEPTLLSMFGKHAYLVRPGTILANVGSSPNTTIHLITLQTARAIVI
jgi:hypothetical protein